MAFVQAWTKQLFADALGFDNGTLSGQSYKFLGQECSGDGSQVHSAASVSAGSHLTRLSELPMEAY